MRWFLPLLLSLAALSTMLAGCADDGDGTDTGGGDGTTAPPPPAAGIPEAPSALTPLALADPDPALGFWLDGDLAYVSGPTGLRIVDLSDPAAPVTLATEVEGTQSSRDVDLLRHPDGRLFAVVSFDEPKVALVDVTDPRAPTLTAEVPTDNSHTVAVVPNSTVVYVSHSILVRAPGAGESGKIDIIDFADPAAPVATPFVFPAVVVTAGGVPKPVSATTCHEITFEPGKQWALCSGVTETHVWNVADPLAPQILQVIDWAGNNIHHTAWTARNGTLLLIGDEFAGVLAPTPTCTAPAPLPTSAVWFFDVSDLAAPIPLGFFQVDHNAVTSGADYCSTHLGDVLDGRDLLVIGWYSAGTVLVDFSDPAMPRQLAIHTPGGSTWEARFLGSHVVAADSVRGLEVLSVT